MFLTITQIPLIFAVPFLALAMILFLAIHSTRVKRLFAVIPNVNLTGGSGVAAVGSILYLGNLLSPQTYLALGNQGNFKWSLKNGTADTTNMGTAWKQHITTLHDAGTVTVMIHAVPGSPGIDASATGLEGDSFTTGLGSILVSGAVRQWKYIFADGTIVFFDATMTDFAYDDQVDKDIQLSITLQITGMPLFI